MGVGGGALCRLREKVQEMSEAHNIYFLQVSILIRFKPTHLLQISFFLAYIPAPSPGTRACASSTLDVP